MIDFLRRYDLRYYLPILLTFSIPISTSLTTLCMLSLGAFWLLDGSYKKKVNDYWEHPLGPMLIMLLTLTLLMSFFSYGTKEAVLERISDTIRICLIPVFGYYIISQRQIYYCFYAFIAAMVVTLLAAMLKVYLHVPIGEKYTAAAVFKTHIDTNFFMSLAAFYVIFLACYQKRYRPFLIGLAVLMLHYVFFMSMGRIGHLATFVIGAYVAYHYYGKKGLILSFFGLGLIGLLIFEFSDIFQQRMSVLVQDWAFFKQNRLVESSLGSRIQFDLTSLALIEQRPLLGWGTGAFGAAYYQMSQGAYLFTDNPHNEFLRIGVELGLAGLLLLVALFVRQWQLYQQVYDHWRVLARGSLLLFIMGCTINSWLMDFSLSYFFVMFSAISFSSYTTYKPGDLIRVPLH